jgi:acyl-CoA synthetase (AMP-forming)/AMP-acid ligase II
MTAMATTVGNLLLHAAGGDPDATALVLPPQRLTYKELLERAMGTARGLAGLGLGAGDRVGILMPNCCEFVESVFALSLLGAVPVPINTRLQPPEIAYVVDHAGLRAVLTVRGVGPEPDFVDLLARSLPEGAGTTEALGSITLFDVVAQEDAGGVAGPSEVAFILYTSGTTSHPKGVRLSHDAVTRTGIARFEERHDRGHTAIWTPCPLFHVGALIPLVGCVGIGAPFVTQRQFDPTEALRLWEAEGVTTALPLFPAFTDAILADPAFDTTDRRSLRQILTTGDAATVERVQRAIAPARLVSAYGMTELCGVAASSPLDETDEARRAWDGTPFEGIEMRIVDPATRRPLPPGELGEIAARGYCVLDGYHNDPDATSAAIDADGWFHTGDLGLTDGHGRIAFRGRGRDMLKVGGENVAPLEVETRLARHPAVRHVEVVGAPDARLDEVVAAFVELEPGQEATEATEADLIAHCRGAVAHFKVPRHLRFVGPGEWPMSATKVSKAALRRRIADELVGTEPGGAGVSPGKVCV